VEARLRGDYLSHVIPSSSAGDAYITVTNPLSTQHSVLRHHLAASLLGVLSLNERQGREDVAIFEIGKGYGRAGELPIEWSRLGLLLSGSAEPAAWNRVARAYDLDDAKGIVELLCRHLGLGAPAYEPAVGGYPLHPGRALYVQAGTGDNALSGYFGELHPEALEAWELRTGRVIVAELAMAGLDGGAASRIHVEPIGRFPVVERDLAIIVSEKRVAAEVEEVIRRHAGDLLRGLSIFDLYRGAPLAADEKSLAYRLVFGSNERTLTEGEVEAAVAAVRDGLAADLGARIRT
jgi:phenylalanyl-tRNA synthetase beta chain